MYTISPGVTVVRDALESWAWIGIDDMSPILVSAFGDVFFESSEGCWFLDTIEGKLKHICRTKEELEGILASEEGKDLYFLSGFVDRAIREGRKLVQGECYDFKIYPIVGGAVDYTNIEKMIFQVSLHLRGQLHDQVRYLPPGTKISKFVFADQKKKKSFWKLW